MGMGDTGSPAAQPADGVLGLCVPACVCACLCVNVCLCVCARMCAERPAPPRPPRLPSPFLFPEMPGLSVSLAPSFFGQEGVPSGPPS